VNLGGTLAPGLSPGTLTISGAVVPTAAATFDVEIGGLVAGSEHDRAALITPIVLTGALDVALVNGFVPQDLDTFTILTSPAVTGTFLSVNVPPLGGDLAWKIHYNPTSVVLEVLDDLDGDGVRNLSDCAPENPIAWSVPAEVSGVGFGIDLQTLSWSSLAAQAGPALTYDLMRGFLSQLPAGGGAAETCVVPDTPSTQASDSTPPATGTGFYYLVRGTNVCGVGTYGQTSSGAPRLTTACP
jgi:hypothetical protein